MQILVVCLKIEMAVLAHPTPSAWGECEARSGPTNPIPFLELPGSAPRVVDSSWHAKQSGAGPHCCIRPITLSAWVLAPLNPLFEWTCPGMLEDSEFALIRILPRPMPSAWKLQKSTDHPEMLTSKSWPTYNHQEMRGKKEIAPACIGRRDRKTTV